MQELLPLFYSLPITYKLKKPRYLVPLFYPIPSFDLCCILPSSSSLLFHFFPELLPNEPPYRKASFVYFEILAKALPSFGSATTVTITKTEHHMLPLIPPPPPTVPPSNPCFHIVPHHYRTAHFFAQGT